MLHVKTVEKWCYALAYRSRVAERLLSVDRVMNAFVEHAERHVRKSTLRLRMKVTQEARRYTAIALVCVSIFSVADTQAQEDISLSLIHI